jgi:hypothetical protein
LCRRLFFVLATSITASANQIGILPASLTPDGATFSPQGSIDLADSPSKRWAGLISDIITRHGFDYSFAPLFDSVTPHLPALAPLVDFLVDFTSTNYLSLFSEIEGMALAFQVLIINTDGDQSDYLVAPHHPTYSHCVEMRVVALGSRI